MKLKTEGHKNGHGMPGLR